jgi:hypothetical protein
MLLSFSAAMAVTGGLWLAFLTGALGLGNGG